MKKGLAIVVVLAVILGPVLIGGLTGAIVGAASTAWINITATGSEVDIACNQTAWNVGTVSATDNIATGDAWARITNNTSVPVDITIRGYDMENLASTRTWTLSDNGSAGAGIIGMQAAQSGASFNITIKKNAAYNNIATTLVAAGTQDFGMCFVAPLSSVGNDEMRMVGAGGTPFDNPQGVCLTAALSP